MDQKKGMESWSCLYFSELDFSSKNSLWSLNIVTVIFDNYKSSIVEMFHIIRQDTFVLETTWVYIQSVSLFTRFDEIKGSNVGSFVPTNF